MNINFNKPLLLGLKAICCKEKVAYKPWNKLQGYFMFTKPILVQFLFIVDYPILWGLYSWSLMDYYFLGYIISRGVNVLNKPNFIGNRLKGFIFNSKNFRDILEG